MARSTDRTVHEPGSLTSYSVGFGLSLIFTLLAFVIVIDGWLDGVWLMVVLVGLALAQLVVQLVFFLHLGRESRPRWNYLAFLFALLVVFILVGGSLWIMSNLEYNMMPQQMDEYMLEQSNKGF